MDDLYKKLQIDPQAEPEVIRAAYHALARKYHPDTGGDAPRMVELNAAWAVLGDRLLRSAYDTEREQVTARRRDPLSSDGHGPSEAPPRSRHDSSSVLDFGRYAGWSLEQLVKSDPDYAEWLVRTPIGRRLSAEVNALLEVRVTAVGTVGVGHHGPRTSGPIGARRGRASAGRQWFGRTRQGR